MSEPSTDHTGLPESIELWDIECKKHPTNDVYVSWVRENKLWISFYKASRNRWSGEVTVRLDNYQPGEKRKTIAYAEMPTLIACRNKLAAQLSELYDTLRPFPGGGCAARVVREREADDD